MGKNEIQKLVEDIHEKNKRADALIETRFKRDIPAILEFRFTSTTEEHGQNLMKDLKTLGFVNLKVWFGQKEWLIAGETNTPIKSIMAQKYVEKLASLLAKHKCSLDRWQKKYTY